MKKTVCELFAGVGGFRLGLERSSKDWEIVWANQWEPGRVRQDAYNCYCKHFGKSEIHVNSDISTVNKTTIPNHSLLVGGFPCQDYSVARSGAEGITGKKGVLWWQIRDVLEAKHPPFVLLENVDRLLKSPSKQRGRDFGIILASFRDLEYIVEWRVVNAADYGFVQRRRRIFLFAYQEKTSFGKTIAKMLPEDILNETGFFAQAFPANPCELISETTILPKDLLEISESFSFPFKTSGYMFKGMIRTGTATPKYEGKKMTMQDIMDSDVDKRYFLSEEALRKIRYLKGAKKIERTASNGHKYSFSEGAIAFPDAIDKPARTILTSEGTINRSSHVIKDPYTGKFRFITPNEANKIQGFDAYWTNTGMSERFQYFCMGNALVVGCVEQMGKILIQIIGQET